MLRAILLDAEDVFDCAPTSIFNRTFFESGYISLYTDCSAFGIEIAEHQAENKKRSALPSNEVSGKHPREQQTTLGLLSPLSSVTHFFQEKNQNL